MTPSDETPVPVGEDRVIDLDAARAARAEKLGPAPVVRFLGREWPLPAEIPAIAVHAIGELVTMDVDPDHLEDLDPRTMVLFGQAIESLFGGQWGPLNKAARKAGTPLSLPDEAVLLEGAMVAYGLDLGESPASASS